MDFYATGPRSRAMIAHWVKRWPAYLPIPSARPAWVGTFPTIGINGKGP